MAVFWSDERLAELMLSHVRPYLKVDEAEVAGVPNKFLAPLMLDPFDLVAEVFAPQWSAWLKAAANNFASMSEGRFMGSFPESVGKAVIKFDPKFKSSKHLVSVSSSAGRLLVHYFLSADETSRHTNDMTNLFSLEVYDELRIGLDMFAFSLLEHDLDALEDKLYLFTGLPLPMLPSRVLDYVQLSVRIMCNMIAAVATHNSFGDSVDEVTFLRAESLLKMHFGFVEEYRKLGVSV